MHKTIKQTNKETNKIPRDFKIYTKIPEGFSAKICHKEYFLGHAKKNHSSTRQLYWTPF